MKTYLPGSIQPEDIERFGFIEVEGRYMETFWSCELWTNPVSEWTDKGIVITDDAGTIEIVSALSLARFIDFEKFLGMLKKHKEMSI